MSDNIINTGLLSELSAQKKYSSEPKSNELGQDAFLQLMITQMNNQNPLEPQSNSEFVAQLAQFSSVEGIDKLNTSLEGMAASFQSSQALQASSLVGRSVKVLSDKAQLENGGSVFGTVALPYNTTDLKVNIYDDSDVLVGQQLLSGQKAGNIDFSWDGVGSDGSSLPAGQYRFEAIAMRDGKPEQLNTALGVNVNSVTVAGGGVINLNIAGLGSVPMSHVIEIL